MNKNRVSLTDLYHISKDKSELEREKLLIELSQKNQGKPFIVEDYPFRMLYLDPSSMQSVAYTPAPGTLVCGYSLAMMGYLKYTPNPVTLLIIGLGGGSIIKYCEQQYPHLKITAVELNQDVIALSKHFSVGESEMVEVIHGDGKEFIEQSNRVWDVIIIDAFGTRGPVQELATDTFYATCRKHLSRDGTLVVNTWGKPKAISQQLLSLHLQFDNQVRWLRSPDSYNFLIFSVNGHISDNQANCDEKIAALFPQHEQISVLPLTLEHIWGKVKAIMIPDDAVPQTYSQWRRFTLKALNHKDED